MKTCTERGCNRPHSAKGLCKPHYEYSAYRAQGEQRRARARQRYHENRDSVLAAVRLATYGLSEDEFQAMLAKQSHGCAICDGKPSGRKTRLCIDHCHTSGRVRGLLCDACNRAIGLIGDDPVRLERAATYLRDGAE